MNNKPKIAILRWEEGHVPQGLLQLETLTGNSTNPDSYPFELKMVHVPGANSESVILNPSKKLLNDMISISRKLIEDGACAIVTSCGFNAIFQQEMCKALTVPVLSSALLQIPMIKNIIGPDKTIGILTANGKLLTSQHFKNCGVEEDTKLYIMGLEESEEWNTIFEHPDDEFDLNTITKEITNICLSGINECKDMGAILLECTDLPPFATLLREKTGLPVFDFSSMIGWIAQALGELRLY